jgi:hypothetical protein
MTVTGLVILACLDRLRAEDVVEVFAVIGVGPVLHDLVHIVVHL